MLDLQVADIKSSSRSCRCASLLQENESVSLSKVSAAEQRARCVLVIQPGCTLDQVVNENCEESSLKMLKILVFWIFNSALPSSDVGSDLFTFYDLYKSQHYKWAAVTLVLMFNPFLFHTGVFPFSLPVINCFNTLRLYKLGFGMKGFDDRNWKEYRGNSGPSRNGWDVCVSHRIRTSIRRPVGDHSVHGSD